MGFNGMKNINIDKEFIKKLHGLNQIVKHVFKQYVLHDNHIYCHKGGPNCGEHFIQFKTDSIIERFEVPEGYLLVLNSANLFQVLSKQKKYVEWFMCIDDQFIFVHPETKEETVVGSLVNTNNLTIPNLVNVVNKNDFKANVVMSEEEVYDITKNALKKRTLLDKYKIMITRSLIPGLKKNQGVRILISDYEGDENQYFFRLLLVNKADKDTLCFHSYKCILY